jgi:hypothetical protein
MATGGIERMTVVLECAAAVDRRRMRKQLSWVLRDNDGRLRVGWKWLFIRSEDASEIRAGNDVLAVPMPGGFCRVLGKY